MVKLIRRFVLLVALVGAAYAGFRWGPVVFPRLEQALGIGGGEASLAADVSPTAELADSNRVSPYKKNAISTPPCSMRRVPTSRTSDTDTISTCNTPSVPFITATRASWNT